MKDVNRLPVAQFSACSLSAAFCDYRETMRLKVRHFTTFMNRTLTAESYASFCVGHNQTFLQIITGKNMSVQNVQTWPNENTKWTVAITQSQERKREE